MSAPFDINAFLGSARCRLQVELEPMLQEHARAIASEATNFIRTRKAEIQTYITQYAHEEITKAEFESQMRSIVGLAEMHALTEVVLAKAKKDAIFDKITAILVDVAFQAIKLGVA